MSSPVQVGEVLAGKYKVEGVLGSGGMGVVVAARHMHLGDRVAIKFLLPQALCRKEIVDRFRREGQAARKIQSEHIARVFDIGELENGSPYLVMEYLEGSDLGAILRVDGKLPIQEAVDYVLQACEALAEAHAVGVIHRDLKPANLFLTRLNDDSPSIKIIDFGISKVGPQDTSVDPSLPPESHVEMTGTDMSMGTPLYMAPEQMVSARDVDARADIWSLGVILHTLLGGESPFRGGNIMEVYERIVRGAPPLRQFRNDAPEGLEKLILRCLRKDRVERFENVADLAAELALFGSQRGRSSAKRTARILRARSMARTSILLDPLTSPLSISRRPLLEESADSDDSDTGSASDEADTNVDAPSRRPSPSATHSSWWQGTTRSPRFRRRPAVILTVTAALAFAVGFGLVMRHVRVEPAASAAVPSPIAPAALAPAAQEIVAASVSAAGEAASAFQVASAPAPSAVDSAASPSASASAARAPEASRAAAPRPVTSTPSPSPSLNPRADGKRTTPKKDLFSDPR